MTRDSMLEKDDGSLLQTTLDLPQLDISDRTSTIRAKGSVRPSYEKRESPKWLMYITLAGFVFLLVSIGSSLQTFLTGKRDKRTNLIRYEKPQKRIKRLALLRPFGSRMISSMPDSFVQWDEYLPCASDHQDNGVIVDLFISLSQTYDSDKIARDSTDKLVEIFLSKRNEEEKGWAGCVRNIHFIEASIPLSEDLYLPAEATTNKLWVNGPNQQFLASMEQIVKHKEQYDAVLLLEHDCIPVKQFWLDTFLAEAETGESFAILGSKYDGDSWNAFRSELPLALQHHINGNAMYNVTHPLMRKILSQLREESDTPYNAVPYDYRISQMIIEGMLGVKPDLPEVVVENWQKETGQILKSYSKRFHRWWNRYGEGKIVRESKVISNYASTNLLPHHLEEEKASLIHGAKHFLPWDKSRHNITLVVSDWHDELSFNILYQIDSANHPFSKLILLVPDNLPKRSISHLSSAETKIDLSVQERKNDFFDVCNANVETEWFMITNSYHVIADHVNLLFNEEYKPVIPYTPSDHKNCVSFPACREAYEKSKQFDPNTRMIVQDSQMLFNTKERNKFCEEWKRRFGESRMETGILKLDESIGTMGPSASTYAAYLSAKGSLKNIYEFTDQTFYGARDNFKRIFTEAAERAALYGETPLANYILHNSNKANGRMLHMERVLQAQAPSFSGTPPPVPVTLSPTTAIKTRNPTVTPTSRPSIEPPPLFLFFGSNEDTGGNALVTAPPISTAPSSFPSVYPSKGPTLSPTKSPIAAAPTKTEEEDKLEEIRACKTWCYLISTPWKSPDTAVFPKCLWKFSCGSCPECNE